MIRLVQKKLIIPRGDTGVFSLPVPQNANTGDVAVFSIIDPRTHTKVYEKIADASTQTISIEFSHNDTVNLPVGKYVWDVKFYANPVFADGKLVNGDQVDSYYSAYKLPDCDITPTGDNLLTSDDSPSTTLTPEALDVLSSTLAETTTARDVAIQQATAAGESASIASSAAESASADATTATSAAATAVEAESQASASATSAINSAASAAMDASAASTDAASAAQSATSAANDAASASASATNAAASATEAQGYAAQITGLSATAETLPAGAPATASYDAISGVLTLGLPQGDAFHIVKTYASIAAMNADYSGTDVAIGEFVMIVSNVEDPDNAKVYVKGDHAYNFIVDMSGVTGLNGVGIVSIVKTSTVENIDTYTITYTDGNTTTYNVVNGIDGDEYTVMVQNTQPTQETNKLWIPTQAGVVQEVPTVQEMNAAIAAIDVPVKDVQVNGASILQNGVANVPFATDNNPGLLNTTSANGFKFNTVNGIPVVSINSATPTQIKSGSETKRPIVPAYQYYATFYGLAKSAGDTTQRQSENAVGTYTDEAKDSIQRMLGIDSLLAVHDTSTATAAHSIGEVFIMNSKLYRATAAIAIGDTIAAGTNCEVVKVADVFPRDVQVNGASVVQDGVANVPVAAWNKEGVAIIGASPGDPGYWGITMGTGQYSNVAMLALPTDAQIKSGTGTRRPVTVLNQHQSAFYGMAKAAGDTTQSASSNAVGTYTETAKSKISEMLNGSVAVTGTTPTITALSGIQYVCGEVATLDITLPASGIVDVVFESGSTPTALNINPPTGMTAEWANGFDSTSLEADTLYELNIRMVGTKCLGVAGAWS